MIAVIVHLIAANVSSEDVCDCSDNECAYNERGHVCAEEEYSCSEGA